MRATFPMIFVTTLLLAGCGGRGGAGWNDDTATELKTRAEQMFRDIDSGNFAGLKLWADRDAVLFDFDENNAPVAARGGEALDKYLNAYDAAVRKGLKVKTTISKEDCMGDADIGFCTLEFDQTIGQAQTPFKFRGTLIARKAKEGWRWVHWHASFREFPKPAAPATAAPTEVLPVPETASPTPPAPP